MSVPIITVAGDEGLLCCPACHSVQLHHDQVEVFEREEDAPKGLHVMVGDGGVGVDTRMTQNPSSRRHGLRIHFRCENCGTYSILSLAQHKGWTVVEFTKE